MKAFLILLLVYTVTAEKIQNYVSDDDLKSGINFCLFAGQERNVTYKDHLMLNQVGFNKNLPTVFVIHGFMSGYTFVKDFRQAYGSDVPSKMNLIGIDWSNGAGSMPWQYPTVVGRVPTIGAAIGEFIIAAIKSNIIPDPYKVHVVGHSLGAHISGFVGKYMATNGKKLQHITALDPAGPTIGSYPCKDRICDSDASFVEIIHSNGGYYASLGMWDPVKPLDFYLNGGSTQPGCILPTCSHSFSHEWYRQVMNERQIVPGWCRIVWICNNLDQLQKEKKCKNANNPRNYRYKLLQDQVTDGGLTYVTSQNTNFVKRAKSDRLTATNDTLVVFGANGNNINLLASLLSDDGNLEIKVVNDQIKVINPSNYAWKPDPKYHLCDEPSVRGIRDCLSEMTGPFRYIMVFDTTDIFQDPF